MCFDKKSQKERINGKIDQKVIKNLLLKTDVILVIRPFVAILEPKKRINGKTDEKFFII